MIDSGIGSDIIQLSLLFRNIDIVAIFYYFIL